MNRRGCLIVVGSHSCQFLKFFVLAISTLFPALLANEAVTWSGFASSYLHELVKLEDAAFAAGPAFGTFMLGLVSAKG